MTMGKKQDDDFKAIAGQLVKDGIREYMPLNGLEDGMDGEKFLELGKIAGLIPKIGLIHIAETSIFENPLTPYLNHLTMEYGSGREKFWFTHGTPNKAWDGKCVPRETVTGVSQVDAINFAWNTEISVKDTDYKLALRSAEELGSFTAEMTKTLYKGLSAGKFTAWKQVLSNVVGGTRNIASTNKSDGTGGAVTYNPTVTGYAGVIRDFEDLVVPEVEMKKKIPTMVVGDVLSIVEEITDSVSDMVFEQSVYNGLGVNNHLIGKPVLVMEKKVVDAMNNSLRRAPTSSAIPTKTIREILTEDADLVEIDSFASIPTNVDYEGKRLLATMVDRRALWEINNVPYTAESQRCVTDRSNNINLQGRDMITIDRGYPSCAFLVDKEVGGGA